MQKNLPGGLGETGFDKWPVDNLPKSSQMIWTAILVIQIVGMFPHIKCQQRFQPL